MKRTRLLLLLVLGFGLSGCLNLLAPRPDQTHFYLLSASSRGPVTPAISPLVIGLGPIDFPQYLARTEIVTRSASNQIQLASRDRWAEPLDVTFSRVLSMDLSRALGDAQVVVFPAFGANYIFNYRVSLTVDRFETDSSGTARLAGRWNILAGQSGRSLYASSSDIREPSRPGDTASAAAALSQAAAALASQIAQAITSLNVNRSTPGGMT